MITRLEHILRIKNQENNTLAAETSRLEVELGKRDKALKLTLDGQQAITDEYVGLSSKNLYERGSVIINRSNTVDHCSRKIEALAHGNGLCEGDSPAGKDAGIIHDQQPVPILRTKASYSLRTEIEYSCNGITVSLKVKAYTHVKTEKINKVNTYLLKVLTVPMHVYKSLDMAGQLSEEMANNRYPRAGVPCCPLRHDHAEAMSVGVGANARSAADNYFHNIFAELLS
uniref:Uncharacterized protein n=1 Tax=Cannabis sativa TaxID=3483 RepID=A0A803QHK2_CANSA